MLWRRGQNHEPEAKLALDSQANLILWLLSVSIPCKVEGQNSLLPYQCTVSIVHKIFSCRLPSLHVSPEHTTSPANQSQCQYYIIGVNGLGAYGSNYSSGIFL